MSSSPYHDAFPQLFLPLSMADWERLPRNPAYKYEYFDNRAVLTPRADTRSALLTLASWQPVRFRCPFSIRALADNDWTDLGPVFHSAFAGQLPYTCLSAEEGRALAEACLAYTRQGKDGELVPQACLTAHDDRGLAGAALVTLQSSAGFEALRVACPVPHLTWILARCEVFILRDYDQAVRLSVLPDLPVWGRGEGQICYVLTRVSLFC